MNESVGNDTWEWCKDVMKSWLEDPGVDEFEGLDMTALKMDQAYMVGEADMDVGVYTVSDDCFRVSAFITNLFNTLIVYLFPYESCKLKEGLPLRYRIWLSSDEI